MGNRKFVYSNFTRSVNQFSLLSVIFNETTSYEGVLKVTEWDLYVLSAFRNVERPT